jgi:hypothetical protein
VVISARISVLHRPQKDIRLYAGWNFTKVIEGVLSKAQVRTFMTFSLLYLVDDLLFRSAHECIKYIRLFLYYNFVSLRHFYSVKYSDNRNTIVKGLKTKIVSYTQFYQITLTWMIVDNTSITSKGKLKAIL